MVWLHRIERAAPHPPRWHNHARPIHVEPPTQPKVQLDQLRARGALQPIQVLLQLVFLVHRTESVLPTLKGRLHVYLYSAAGFRTGYHID